MRARSPTTSQREELKRQPEARPAQSSGPTPAREPSLRIGRRTRWQAPGGSTHRLARSDQHRLPQPRPAAGTAEGHRLEAGLLQKGCEGGAAPELDVAAVPEGGEVAVELAAEGQRAVLEVAVIRLREDQHTARLEGCVGR
jgi:hypothetical protein